MKKTINHHNLLRIKSKPGAVIDVNVKFAQETLVI